MSDQPRVTEYTTGEIHALLRAEWPHASNEPSFLASGTWSDCFTFQSAGTDSVPRDYVIRVGAQGEDFHKDQIAGRFASASLPIPQVGALGRVGNDYFAVSDRVFGKPLEQSLDWPGLITPLVDVLQAMQRVDLAMFDGWGRWDHTLSASAASWREFLLQVNQDPKGTRIHGWRAKLDASPRLLHLFEQGYQQLVDAEIAETPRGLVHNDLFNRNAHTDQGKITGVFDWGNSMIGDPLYDLGVMCMWEPWWHPRVQAQPVLDELRNRAQQQGRSIDDFGPRLQACLLHTGLEHIAYHVFLGDWTEAQVVADRMQTVVAHPW